MEASRKKAIVAAIENLEATGLEWNLKIASPSISSKNVQVTQNRQKKDHDDNPLSVDEAVERYAVGRSTLYRWLRANKVAATKTRGGEYRIDEASLRDALGL